MPYHAQSVGLSTPDYFQWKQRFRTAVFVDVISVSLRSAYPYTIPTECNCSYAQGTRTFIVRPGKPTSAPSRYRKSDKYPSMSKG